MNKRFEQMMLEATKDMPQGYYVPGEYFQKFAELIVRECSNYVNSRIPGNIEVSATVAKMKKHFGVEEK